MLLLHKFAILYKYPDNLDYLELQNYWYNVWFYCRNREKGIH